VNKKILIIEDEPAILSMMEMFLSKTNSCDVATCLEEAFIQMKNKVYDVVVSDLNLPDSHSHKLFDFKKVNQQEFKIVICTGDSSNTTRLELLEQGVNLVLNKPFSFKLLSDQIKELF
jgi:DNA-binding response OmpR family regulator